MIPEAENPSWGYEPMFWDSSSVSSHVSSLQSGLPDAMCHVQAKERRPCMDIPFLVPRSQRWPDQNDFSLLDKWLQPFSVARFLTFLHIRDLKWHHPIKSSKEWERHWRRAPAPVSIGELCGLHPCCLYPWLRYYFFSLFRRRPGLTCSMVFVSFLWQSSHSPEYKNPNSIWLQFKSLTASHT